MSKVIISEEHKQLLEKYLTENRPAELISTYLFFIEKKFNLQPVLFPRDKIIYESAEEAVKALESEGKLWHETEIKISFGEDAVNEQTTKIYICPFTGKVFGDNTHPNPQDAIYDWVSKCPENKERHGGLPVKRFFVSEDPEVIKSYIGRMKIKEPIKKVVYSSVLSGKLFNSKESVIKDFKNNYLKPMSLDEVQNQDKFKIEEKFLDLSKNNSSKKKLPTLLNRWLKFENSNPL